MHSRAKNNSPPQNPHDSPSSRRDRCAAVGGEAHTPSVGNTAERDVLLTRCEIAEAYYRGGDSLALAVLAASSLRLYGGVVSGDLSPNDLFDDLQECAINLGIAARAQDQVHAAISFGPRRYGAAA